MKEKPQRRLVRKGEYLALMIQRALFINVLLPISLLLGLSVLGFAVVVLMTLAGMQDDWGWIGNTCAYACSAVALSFLARYLYKSERKVERVALLTKRTSHLLPPEDSLVRASDLPSAQQQAELLRAAQNGNETPAEELLQAAEESR